MPLIYKCEVDDCTRIGIWKIEEDETFFDVPIKRDIRHPHKKLQHFAGRYLLRYLFPDFPLELIKIADTKKPFLEDEAYHFSISHCDDYAAVIVSKNQRVGIDIEIATEKINRIKEKFLHPEELQATLDLSPISLNYLTLLWSCKEAVFKWWSFGNVDFRQMIRITDMPIKKTGIMKACFISPEKRQDLAVHYEVLENFNLTWIATEIA